MTDHEEVWHKFHLHYYPSGDNFSSKRYWPGYLTTNTKCIHTKDCIGSTFAPTSGQIVNDLFGVRLYSNVQSAMFICTIRTMLLFNFKSQQQIVASINCIHTWDRNICLPRAQNKYSEGLYNMERRWLIE